MSEYENFLIDFPRRTKQLLELCYANAQANNREVTLLLSLAAAGIAIPLGILTERDHPSPERRAALQQSCDRVLDVPFVASQFCKHATDWKAAETVHIQRADLEGALENTPNEIGSWKVRDVLGTIRNSLAHGNGFTQGDPIARVVFVARKRKNAPLHFTSASPRAFKELFIEWCGWLETVKDDLVKMSEAE